MIYIEDKTLFIERMSEEITMKSLAVYSEDNASRSQPISLIRNPDH